MKLQDALMATGLNQPEAAVVAFLITHDDEPATVAGIMKKTGLRQPQVCLEMQKMRERGWVKVTTRDTTVRGRPSHSYHLVASHAAVLVHYTANAYRKVRELNTAIGVIERNG